MPERNCTIQSIHNDVPKKAFGAFRILHFSDIHLGLLPRISEVFNKRFLGAVNHLFRRRYKLHPEYIDALAEKLNDISPDLIVFTGDLSSVATQAEISAAVKRLLPFRDFADFVFVPGNHDAYVKDALPYLNDAFNELNGGRWQLDSLPIIYNKDNIRFCLLNASRPLSPLLSCGDITPEMQEKIDALCPKGTETIMISHFPAFAADGSCTGWRHGLRNEEFLRRKVNEGTIPLILSGHVHKPYIFTTQNHGTQLCAGSLTLNGAFGIIDIGL